ncbi:MAG: hypothetical protein AAF690_18170 [Acidobacteriota bacterium]
MKRTPLRRKAPLRRSSRINPVNTRRRKKLQKRNFGRHAEWIRQMPCALTGAPGPSDPHHTVRRGMGGCGGDRSTLVPLSREAHEEVERSRDPETERVLRMLAQCLWAVSPYQDEEDDS